MRNGSFGHWLLSQASGKETVSRVFGGTTQDVADDYVRDIRCGFKPKTGSRLELLRRAQFVHRGSLHHLVVDAINEAYEQFKSLKGGK